MRIEVWVTPQNIREGKRGDPCQCPVALAMKDAGFLTPEVYSREITWLHGQCKYSIFDNDVSPTVARFTEDFDNGGTVLPIRFTISSKFDCEAHPQP